MLSNLVQSDDTKISPEVRRIRFIIEISKLLSDETRMKILVILRRGALNVGRITDSLQTPQPTTSHHLALLRKGGLVTTSRDGKEIYYRLHDCIRFVDDCLEIRISGEAKPVMILRIV